MVAAGLWKDYAIDFGPDYAAFWAFRRTAERPEYKIEKRPALRSRQGQWALIGEHGMVLKRGHELGPVLAPIEPRLFKRVAEELFRPPSPDPALGAGPATRSEGGREGRRSVN